MHFIYTLLLDPSISNSLILIPLDLVEEMAAGAPNMDQFELYFKRADLDQDGRISGAEAVSFFKASGLPTPVLAQIWTFADHNRTGFLGRPEFYNALKLVTVAQSKRDLTPALVKTALYGPASTKIPAPQINIAALQTPAGPTGPQMHNNTPPASHSTGIRGPQGFPPQQSQNIRPHVAPIPNSTLQGANHGLPGGQTVGSNPRPSTSSLFNEWLGDAKVNPTPNGQTFSASGPGPKDSSSSVAGNGFVPTSGGTQFSNKSSQFSQVNVAQQPTAGQNQQVQSTMRYNQQIPVQNSSIPSGQSLQPWPKMTQLDVQKYTKVFVEVDTDKDGKITGEQARTLFLSWKLPRDILMQVWDLSDQDNDRMLSLKEFCIALYLMERYRENRPLPKVLPPGIIFEGPPFPPSGQPYGPPGVQQGYRMTAQRQVSNAAARPPRPVPIPLDEDAQPRQQKAKVPVLEKHLVDQLSNEEQSLLNSKFQEATEADKKVGELEKEILEAKQKIEFYRSKMQEIILYKSRCDTRLNEIIERFSADKREVDILSKKYEEKYKQSGDVASKLTIEEATFRDIQEKKMELYRAIVKLDQDGNGKPDEIQVKVDQIQADLEEQIKSLNERCKMYGLRGKPTLLVELPFGWQVGIQEGAADWDEDWDKFEDEGYTFVKELTLDVQNVIAPPKQKSPPVQNKSTFQDEKSTAVSSTITNDKSETENEKIEQQKDSNKSIKTPPDSPASIKSTDSPSKTFQDSSPRAVNNLSESMFLDERKFDEPVKATFDSHYDSDAGWDFTATNHKDMDEESFHGNSLFDSSDNWGLNPIKTEIPKKSTFAFDNSVPSTPTYSYTGSPPANNLFHNPGPFASSFDNSVPSTPAYSQTGSPKRPFSSLFADSVPSTPMFPTNDSQDHSFNDFSRFDSFNSSSNNPVDSFSRFDSFRSSADSDFGHSFQARDSFPRFDSMRSSTNESSHGFSSFDDVDPFGSRDPFRGSVESETPRRDSVDGWKAF